MYLGIDIGGTDIKFGVVTENGELVNKQKITTPKTTDDIIDSIVTVCNNIKKNYTIFEIGIACPGIIKNGIVEDPGNLPFYHTPLAGRVSEKVKLPVKIGNDAHCAGIAESECGMGRDVSNMVLITLGTGIGGAIIVDGHLYQGHNGGAGEVGHITLNREGEPCPCGRNGCFERYASVTALIRQTIDAANKYPDSILANCCREKPVNGKTVFTALEQDCPIAANVYEKYITYLAEGIDSISIMLQPELIVLGGAISREGERLLAPLQKALKFPMRVNVAQLGEDAGVIGAAMLCKQ